MERLLISNHIVTGILLGSVIYLIYTLNTLNKYTKNVEIDPFGNLIINKHVDVKGTVRATKAVVDNATVNENLNVKQILTAYKIKHNKNFDIEKIDMNYDVDMSS